uniref:Leucine-rich repeat-containing N-terminal plant-type domain-containing protein n=1 Tax=Vitis vinifera TaxID=29760 RepID=A5B425_VITVI|nr:hypothetical protein VITISV_019334 [Vitis vinifera]
MPLLQFLALLAMSHLSLLLLFSVFSATHALTLPSDVSALQSFKASIKPSSVSPWSCLASWNFSTDPCSVPRRTHFTCGISCSADSTRVISITLDPAGYAGALSPAIGKLTQLTVLDLSDNSFSGYVPSALSSLSNLQILTLRSNSFSGPLPQAITAIKTRSQEQFSIWVSPEIVLRRFNSIGSSRTQRKRLHGANTKLVLPPPFPATGQFSQQQLHRSRDLETHRQRPCRRRSGLQPDQRLRSHEFLSLPSPLITLASLQPVAWPNSAGLQQEGDPKETIPGRELLERKSACGILLRVVGGIGELGGQLPTELSDIVSAVPTITETQLYLQASLRRKTKVIVREICQHNICILESSYFYVF